VQFFVGGYLEAQREHGPAPHRIGARRRANLFELGWEPEFEDDEFEGADFGSVGRRSWYPRHLAEALVAVAIVAGILFYASRPHGWNAVSDANRARAEAVFSREASKIAGHPANVVCDTSGAHVGIVQEADGAAQVGGRTAYLVPSLCDRLYQLRFKNRVQSFPGTARAIAVLAHEAWHLNGVGNEGLANCFGVPERRAVGVDLGLSESRAAR
jgi:hypothetical protein